MEQEQKPNIPDEENQESIEPREVANIPNDEDEEQALQQLMEELKVAEESVDKNFVDYAANRLEDTPELEELFFNDKKEFLTAILELQKTFLDDQINSKRAKLGELQDSVMNKRVNSEYQRAKNEFISEYPDENPDELISFAKDSIPPKELDKLIQLSPIEFLKAVKQIKDNGISDTNKGNTLPKDLDGSPTDALNSSAMTPRRGSVFNRA